MRKNKLRKKIESLKRQIEEHIEKIKAEKQKSFPDKGCVVHWEKEIAAFENQIGKAIKKLED